MEIEVGEFVRTNKGIIDKVENYSLGCNVWHCKNGMCIDECNVTGVYLKDIVKHSKHIIDLIELGDIVECMVSKFVENGTEEEETIKYEVVAAKVLDMNGNPTNEIGISGEEGPELISFENVRSILEKLL